MNIPNEHATDKTALEGSFKFAQHLGYLDGMRALAAIFVVLHHSFLQIDWVKQPSPALSPLWVFSYGRYAVDWFIVLSGFCLMLPIVRGDGRLRGSAGRFFLRRARRILPPYYAAIAFSLLLIATLVGQKTGSHWDMSIPVTPRSVITHALLLQDVFGDDGLINHAFWSIAVEWRIYFLFPLLVLLWRRLGLWGTTTVALVGSVVLGKVLSIAIGHTLTAQYIGLFALGMLAATLVFSSDASLARWQRLPWGMVSLGLMLVVLAFSKIGSHLPSVLTDVVVGIWALTVLVWVSRGNNWGYKLLNLPPLVWIGTFAYSIYLIHAPLVQVLWQYPFARLQHSPFGMFAMLALVGTPLIIAASYGFFLLCERPFLRVRAVASTESLVVKTTLEPAP